MWIAEAGRNPFNEIFLHALDHGLGPGLVPSKLTIAMWIGAVVLLAWVLLTDKKSLIPSGLSRGLLESIYFFIRDEMVYPTMGEHHGKRFLPFFLTVFTFIFVLNLIGLVPDFGYAGSAASSLGFTVPMAIIVFLVSVGAGIRYNGFVGFFKGFVPPGLPKVLIPVMFVLELMGFFIKHGVLAVRLFANMLAGHLVIGAFFGLIFLFNTYFLAAASVPLALFMSFVELLVAFLQAYVFTLLSVLFVGGTVHPEH